MTDRTLSRRKLTLGATTLLATSLARPGTLGYAHQLNQDPATKGRALETFETLTEWIGVRIDELGVPGAAVGVAIGDQRFTHGIGVANVDTGESFTPSTSFGIASLTKIFTATALSPLAHDGALRLNDPVRQHLPSFQVAGPEATEAITIGHLLSHSGGWADTLEPDPGQDSLDGYVANMAHLPQIVPVGSHFSYNNSGFLVAGAVIERLAGVRYERAIAESVLQPLGMAGTAFRSDIDAVGAVGHQEVDGKMATLPPSELPRAANPAAGLVSSIDDMLTFLRAHADIDYALFDAAALRSMRQPRTTGGSLGPVVVDNIGTGWMLLDIEGETVLMSQGGDSGLISAMVAVPSREFGMVVFANSDAAMMLPNDAVLRGLVDFLDLELPKPDTHTLTSDEEGNSDGRYEIPNWLSFEVSPAEGSLQVTTSAGGHEIPEMSGRFSMVSATRGFMPYLGGKLWIDLVTDETGRIEWLRFAARLAPRVD